MTPVTLRTSPERCKIVGLLLKFLPLRCRVAHDFAGTLEGLREGIFDLLDRADSFSWDYIWHSELRRRSYTLGSPLEIMYTSTDYIRNQLVLDGKEGEELYLDNGTAKTALTCMVGETTGHSTVTLQWDVRYVQPNDIDGLWAEMVRAIENA